MFCLIDALGNTDCTVNTACWFEKFNTTVTMQDGKRLPHAAFLNDTDMDKSFDTLKSMIKILKACYILLYTIGDHDRNVT